MSAIYGTAAAWRRAWYDRDPSRRRWLERPVVSVGNLRVGGSGKTPIVEYIARMLVAQGERPAVLTRGYARRIAADGVTIVSDGVRVVAELDVAGDEPLMLARALPGVRVLVGADRYLSGTLAERRLGATVHLLDDGFQHFELGRDVDLILVSEEDLADRPMPAGHLRERLEAAKAADAALVTAGYDSAAERIGRAIGVSQVFRVARAIGVPRTITGARDSVVIPPASRVFVATGIARPDRFVADIESAGWEISGVMAFRDHHRFDARDVRRIASEARAKGSAIVVTTEKDAVRLAACDLGALPIASVPLTIEVEPRDAFRRWLVDRIRGSQALSQPKSAITIRNPQPATRSSLPEE